MSFIDLQEREGYAVADCLGLAIFPATLDLDHGIEFAERICNSKGLFCNKTGSIYIKVFIKGFAVSRHSTFTGVYPYAGYSSLSFAGGIVACLFHIADILKGVVSLAVELKLFRNLGLMWMLWAGIDFEFLELAAPQAIFG